MSTEVAVLVFGANHEADPAVAPGRRFDAGLILARELIAIQHALETLPRLDLLFIDLALSNGINGSELAHRALCQRPKTRILLTSGCAQQFPVPEGPLGAGIDLLPKPYRQSELTARIREMLDQPPT